MAGVVIVGGGQGGFQAAASLRQEGYEGPVTLVGDEPGLPYQRPPLSKAYLKDGDAARLALRPQAFYAASDIALVHDRATALDRDARKVALASGRVLPYDHLILAPGARNARPPLPGIDAPGVLGLRTLADARALREALPGPDAPIVVIGGGFIGLEFAAVARAHGCAVTVVEAAPRLMSRAVSSETSARFRAKHEALGVALALGVPVTEVLTDPAGRARGVALADGTEIPGALVLLAVGVRPNVELAQAAGLDIADGIAVDAHLLTSDPAISALGDACSFPDPRTRQRVRLESVQAATDHARAIARRLTGRPAPYAALPWFWSDQADWKLQIAGLPPREETATELHDLPRGGFAVHRWEGDVLVCVETVNAPAEHMAARRLLASGPVTRAALAAQEGSLARLAKAG
ncbi:NAD(P)/FAD-dependent oxidoreductase [Albimonas pacifica]|uniref:3-phenylpropionate/trans-cinnamate dioxygenase ferredoxin reductase subunit n=1 Tax=Albimonas pacifica TaxID=1114924 RepID=A0A1I3CUE5_9RHOB|nr:FAD-dependent oxidoreductase [Albimonas pacifica]SFH78132.1 3-phenylpropionate/trans-cinnamate dioxygenase ferredoxin reductase subunit [Albimonas pacifica]